jgi:hypothetical protein
LRSKRGWSRFERDHEFKMKTRSEKKKHNNPPPKKKQEILSGHAPNRNRRTRRTTFGIVLVRGGITNKSEERRKLRAKKKCGRCSCNKHSLSTVGSATTDVQGIVHKSGESRRTRAPTAHTHTHYSRRRTRIRWGAEREESLKQPRGNGVSPLKELGLIRPELNSKLSDVQVNQETDHQVDLRAYIYMDTLYFFFFCRASLRSSASIIWDNTAQVLESHK